MNNTNNQWITIVLITAVIMLVFLVFYGNKAPITSPEAVPQENQKASHPATPPQLEKK